MNGVFLLNKALGLSSNRAMQQIKRLFNAKKAGHTGSLDPLASGMLPICLGEATKFSQYLLNADKSYEVVGRLGIQTASGDVEGEIIRQEEINPLSMDALQTVISSFIGESYQVPPMYSALKFNGQPLYRYALQGIDIPREARLIHISQLELLSYEHPFFKVRVQCSKGTYMRTLIEDIAKELQTYAHVTSLHRVATGGFVATQMCSLQQLENMSEQDRLAQLLPMDALVNQFEALALTQDQQLKLQQGQNIAWTGLTSQQVYRLYAPDFIGLGQFDPIKGLIAKRMCRY
jgi:tRNA pseudouridine55 synthase